MIDTNELIGLTEEEACRILCESGYNKVEVKRNSVKNEKCNTSLVCAVRLDGEIVTLVCGEFCMMRDEE